MAKNLLMSSGEKRLLCVFRSGGCVALAKFADGLEERGAQQLAAGGRV